MLVRLFLVNLLAIVLLSSTNAQAQSAFEGTKEGITRSALKLYGGQVETMRIGATGNLYVGLNSANGLFCSTDSAASWTALDENQDFGTISDIAIGENALTLYVIGGISLYKTTDACQTWTELAFTPGDAQSNDFSQSLVYGHSVLLVANRNGTIARSADNGATFSSVSVDAGVTNIDALAASPTTDVFYVLAQVSSNQVVYKSTDAGATWTSLSKSGSYSRIGVNPENGNEVVIVGNSVVERSTNGGTSWTNVTPSGIASNSISWVTVGGTQRLYIGSKYSTDGGASWTDLNDTATSKDTELFGHIVASPSSGTTFYISSLRGVAKSTDSQANWTDSVSGLLGVKIYDIAQAVDKNVVYMATLGGLAKTSNYLSESGPTWSYPIDPTGNGNSASAILIDRENPDTVFAGIGSSVYRSSNGGSSWSSTDLSSTGVSGDVTSLTRTSNGRMYAGLADSNTHRGGVVQSTDNGVTWTDTSLTNNASVNDLLAIENVLYAGVGTENDSDASRRGILKHADDSWTQLSGSIDGKKVNDLDYNGAAIFAAAGDVSSGGIYMSSDSGANWSDVGSSLEESRCFKSLAYDPNDTSVLYAATGCPSGNARIYQSDDGGANWSLYYTGLKDEAPDVMLVDDLIVGFDTGAFGFSSASISEYTVGFRLKRLKTRDRRGRYRYTMTGVVRDENSDLKAGIAVQRQYRKKRGKAFKDLGSTKSSNSKGKVVWKTTRRGFYRLYLEDDSSVVSRQRKVR